MVCEMCLRLMNQPDYSDDSESDYSEGDYLESYLEREEYPKEFLEKCALYWDFVSEVKEFDSLKEKEYYLRHNYTIKEQFELNDVRIELEKILLVKYGYSTDILYSTFFGRGVYVTLLSNAYFFGDYFTEEDKHKYRDFGLMFSYQDKMKKTARVIQLKFLDWFYKPVCKDGTFGLNCLLAKQLCTL
jgi:hypothetical protein